MALVRPAEFRAFSDGRLRSSAPRSTLRLVGRSRAALLACAGLAAAGVVGVVAGCGPSFQAVYEGDVRFEHCYALDQTAVSPDAKKDCWREWLHGFTYGQSRDRIEYAAARFSELSLDPTLPSVDTGTRPARRSRSNAAPMPTSAFAPPPNVAGDGSSSPQPPSPPPSSGQSPQSASAPALGVAPTVGAGGAPRAVPVAARAPGEECANACADRWNGCRRGCTDGACDACDRAYRTCVPGCFTDLRHPPRSLR